MSLAEQAAAAVLALAAAIAAAAAWRGAGRAAGTMKHAYWLLGLAALLFGLGAAAQQALAGAGTGSAFPLSAADLPGLLALPVLVAGVARLRPRAETGWHPLAQRRPGRAGTMLAHLADGYVLASALFIVCWLTALGPAYAHSGDGPGTFAAQLVHPLADLLVLGALLPLAAAAGRRGIAPFLALLLLSVGDALCVGARVSAGYPGVAAVIVLVAGLGLLGCAPWLGTARSTGPPDGTRLTRGRLHVSTALAALAAACAALDVIGYGLAGRPAAEPVLVVAAATVLLALTVRIVILLHRDGVRARLWHEAGQQFRELADRTSDAVLVCDYAGRIGYASPAVRDYGYAPDRLAGQLLADLVHPEDRLGGIRAVRAAASAPAHQIRYTCRVRATDGTWRYVEATISRQRSQGAPDRLLVTARDVSEQVALRRQIAHLTYHDGLTGLPNRAYLEERARDALSLDRLGGTARPVDGEAAEGAVAAGAGAAAAAAASNAATGDTVTGAGAASGAAASGGVPGGGVPGGGAAGDAVPGQPAAAGAGTTPGQAAVHDLAPAPAPDGGSGLAGVILLNLDSFSAVNDLAGPAAGDLVLAQVARRLRAVVPLRGTVGRWGGDEFAVLLTGAATPTEITDYAERIRAAVAAEPFRAADRAVALTASVGVAVADGSPAGYVWRNAERCLSAAKKAGGGRVEVYPGLPPADAGRRLTLAAQLSRALAGSELEMDYQPLTDLGSSRVVGVAALPRWRRDGADLPRREFLEAAEVTRVIVDLGDWVLRESCARAAAWHQAGWAASLWLSCSPAQATSPRFAESVQDALDSSGLPPSALILEVPGQVLLDGGEAIVRGSGELRERGTRLAVDISGAGFAAVARLGQLPVDLLVVGPELVARLGVDDAAETLARAAAAVGRDLGLTVAATGIERDGQRELLARFGCRIGLGPLLAGPIPPDGAISFTGEAPQRTPDRTARPLSA
jgi:diguanylate cyclase (GGDEF)-like protein/PAS domain S-box-containing protein